MIDPKTNTALNASSKTADDIRSAHAPTVEPITVSIARAVAMSGVCRSELYNLIGCGRVRAVKRGRKTLVVVASLRDYLLNSLPPAKINPQGRSRADSKAAGP